jgi:hypothetical protein
MADPDKSRWQSEDEDGECKTCIRKKRRCFGEPCRACVRNSDGWQTCVFSRGNGITEYFRLNPFYLDENGEVSYDPTLPWTPEVPGRRLVRNRRTNNEQEPASANSQVPDQPLTRQANVAIADPKTFRQALQSGDSDHWREAMEREYESLTTNDTWDVVPLPPDRKALTCKWHFKIKYGSSGEIVKYKARLVARGFQQEEGVDYQETFASVVRSNSYRVLFAIATAKDWKIHQMDVVTAFLNGTLDEEIYVDPPPGFPENGQVLKLKKSLYGLKQAPRCWYSMLKAYLISEKWVISSYDPCVFILNGANVMVMTVYVDDINIFGPNEEQIIDFKETISSHFKMTDEGNVAFYLRMQIARTSDHLHIHLASSIREALVEFGLENIPVSAVPMRPDVKLEKASADYTADLEFKQLYQSKTGKIGYFSIKGRADISFASGRVAQYNNNPDQSHMDAVDTIFAYLKGTDDFGSRYVKTADAPLSLEGYVDSDFQGCMDTSRSTTGWIFLLGGAPVSWCSQRQKTISHSSCEAEYIAASEASREAVWLKEFINEIGVIHIDTVPLHMDNLGSIRLARNPEFHNRTKHIKRHHHYIREVVEDGSITPIWTSSKDNLADILTKPLGRRQLETLREKCGIVSLAS